MSRTREMKTSSFLTRAHWDVLDLERAPLLTLTFDLSSSGVNSSAGDVPAFPHFRPVLKQGRKSLGLTFKRSPNKRERFVCHLGPSFTCYFWQRVKVEATFAQSYCQFEFLQVNLAKVNATSASSSCLGNGTLFSPAVFLVETCQFVQDELFNA